MDKIHFSAEYLKMRLDLVSSAPEFLADIINKNTSLAVAVFGGISVALVFLHGNQLSTLMNIIMSMFTSVVGIMIAYMIINAVDAAKINAVAAKIETGAILDLLGGIPNKAIQQIIESRVNSFTKENKEKLGNKRPADWLRDIVAFIRVSLFVYLAYSIYALTILIICPEAIKFIW